ncbi:hypothetical protein [Streptomyces sp. MBT84]|uniref:hypothetical protein n=1 Tax=Streptomyces sp. MBT84 TaxID=1488414 RepID=UPI001C6DFC23|nr:hypothetical protein [Streptomyces sp. MBT84]
MRVVAAFKDGWTENGLHRYLDISDDPKVRNPAAVYEHRLSEKELPGAVEAEAVVGQLPPACESCLKSAPESAHNILLRRNYLDPIGGGPCPRCNPEAIAQQATVLPPACEACLDYSPGAATNVRLRVDHLSFHGGPCPRCHPSKVPGDWRWPGMDTPDRLAAPVYGQVGKTVGARAKTHTAGDYENSSVDDLFAPRRNLTLEERINRGPAKHQPYRNPTDQSVYDEDFGSSAPVDDAVWDEPI